MFNKFREKVYITIAALCAMGAVNGEARGSDAIGKESRWTYTSQELLSIMNIVNRVNLFKFAMDMAILAEESNSTELRKILCEAAIKALFSNPPRTPDAYFNEMTNSFMNSLRDTFRDKDTPTKSQFSSDNISIFQKRIQGSIISFESIFLTKPALGDPIFSENTTLDERKDVLLKISNLLQSHSISWSVKTDLNTGRHLVTNSFKA